MKEKILEGAERLFVQYGVRSVSMDDVAREISVSKKTIYQHFSNKDDLVAEVTEAYLKKDRQDFQLISKQAKNAIDELFLISKCMRENLGRINPSLLYDLQKYHREAWENFRKYKNEFIRGQVIKNIERGMKEGYYRPDLDPGILSTVRVELVQMIFDERIFPKTDYEFIQVQLHVFDHFIHGLLSEKGRKLYKEYTLQESKPILK